MIALSLEELVKSTSLSGPKVIFDIQVTFSERVSH